jgi:uncharacterized protein YciW
MRTALSTILELTDQVQTAIDTGDWQGAQSLETERRQRLERLVAEHDAALALKPALEQLQERNHRLTGIVQHHRRRVLREGVLATQSHVAASAYADTSNEAQTR